MVNLDTNSIMRREWLDLVIEDNKEHPELIIKIENSKTNKEKLWALAQFKLEKVMSLLKSFLKTISQEKVTQSVVNSSFEGLRQEAATAYFPYLSILVLKFMTDIHIASRDLSEASVTSKGILLISDMFDHSSEMLESLEIVGNCQRDKRLYKECLETYYKQLYMAWSLSDIRREIRAYDNIGLAYFYLNNVERAYKFHSKAVSAESELESGDAAKKMGERYLLERKRKTQHISTKDQCYRFKVMKQVITDRNCFDQEIIMSGIRPMLTNFAVFDESPIRPFEIDNNSQQFRLVTKTNATSLNLKRLRDSQFKCNFTKDGLMNSLYKSNPLKLDLIKSGMLRVDSHMLKNINLREGSHLTSTLLTHQSQNKSAEAFMSYHNFVNSSADICLEYITADIKSRLRNKVNEYSSIISNIINSM